MLSNQALYKFKLVSDEGSAPTLAWHIEADDGWLFCQTEQGERVMRAQIGHTVTGFLAMLGTDTDLKRDLYEFTIVTLEDFNKNFRPHLADRNSMPAFANTKDLHKFYLGLSYEVR